jgi:hypothetical protein
MAILDGGVHAPGKQVDPSQQAQSAMALVFVIAREAHVIPVDQTNRSRIRLIAVESD